MESIIHQTFRDILLCDARRGLYLIKIYNKFVSYSTLLSTILNSVVLFKLLSHVIGREYSNLGALEKSFSSTHLNVSV